MSLLPEIKWLKLVTNLTRSQAITPTNPYPLVFNTDISKHQGYQGSGVWVDINPNTYYTVLDETASTSDINDALVEYDVVYLKPGGYTNVDDHITIPKNKQLIGLSGSGVSDPWSTEYRPIFALSTRPERHIEMEENALVENINFMFSPASGNTYPMIVSALEGRVVHCAFNGEDNGEGIPVAQSALEGSFREISYVDIVGSFGIHLTSSSWPGATIINNYYWNGYSTSSSNQNSGIYSDTPYLTVRLSDFQLWGGKNGILLSGDGYTSISLYDGFITNGYIGYPTATGGYGMHINEPYVSTISDMTVEGDLFFDSQGIYIDSPSECKIRGLVAIFINTSGITIERAFASTISELTSFSCGFAYAGGAVSPGIFLDRPGETTITNLLSSNDADGIIVDNATEAVTVSGVTVFYSYSNGLSVTNCNKSVFSSITCSDCQVHGFYFEANNRLTISAVLAYNSGGDGVHVATGQSELHFVSGTSSFNTGTGFNGLNSAAPACRLDSWYSYSNIVAQVTLGAGWIDYSTPISVNKVGSIVLDTKKETSLTNVAYNEVGSYIWDADELSVSSILEWKLTIASGDALQTYDSYIQSYDGLIWSDLSSVISTASNGDLVFLTIRLIMDPNTNTSAAIWVEGSTGVSTLVEKKALGSSTFFTTADRGLRVVTQSSTGAAKSSCILTEIRGN